MRERVGETFPGVITAVTGFGLFVELTDIFVEGLVHVTALPGDYYHFDAVHHRLSGERTGRSFRLGDTTEVVVARVDLDERKIDFELAGNVLSAPIGRKKRNGDKSANAGKAPKGRKGASVPEVDLEPALASPDAAVVPRRKAGKVQALPPVAPELLAQAAEMLGNTDVRKSREVKQALLAEARVGGKDKGGKKGKVVPAGKSAKGKAKDGKPAAAAKPGKPGKPTKHRKGPSKPKADNAPAVTGARKRKAKS